MNKFYSVAPFSHQKIISKAKRYSNIQDAINEAIRRVASGKFDGDAQVIVSSVKVVRKVVCKDNAGLTIAVDDYPT